MENLNTVPGSSHLLTTRTLGEAWVRSVQLVLTKGDTSIYDQRGPITEVLNLVVDVTHPVHPDPIITKFGDGKVVDFMRGNFFSTDAILDWGYSYGQRLFAFQGVDQIGKVVDKLKGNAFAKSATIPLMLPVESSKHVPCVTAMDFKIRENTLHLNAFLRSQDIASKMYADLVCLHELAKKVSEKIRCDFVQLHLCIASAHVYALDLQVAERIAEIDIGAVQ